jgi:hypothetical protein
MAHIAPILQQQLLDKQQNDYDVIITLKDNEQLPDILSDKGNFILKDKIYSAKVTAAQLEQLTQDNAIDAIEPDTEMGIM